MSSVLVLGAGGIIGLNVARAFVRNGYKVKGLTRSEEKGKVLAQNQIIPVVANAKDTTTWEKYAEESDIIIEAIADYSDHSTGPTVYNFLAALAKKNKNKIIIATSGVWVLGNTGFDPVSESKVNPLPIVSWRPAVENTLTESGITVIRPAFVFGYGGSILASFFKNLSEGKGEFPGTGEHYWSFVHADDVAQAYLRAAEKPSVSRGQIYNVSTFSERISDVLKAIAGVTGYKGKFTFVEPKDPFSEALALNQFVSSLKIKGQLGWDPKHRSFVENVESLYHSWKASN